MNDRKREKEGKNNKEVKEKKKKMKNRGGNDDDEDIIATPTSSLLDDDNILRVILSRLPVKSIMRFKCVCKQWQSLIQDQDPYLIDLHLTRSKTRPRLLIVFPKKHRQCFLSADFFEDRAAANTITNLFTYYRMLGPINGLTCFVSLDRDAVCIYTLSTQEVTPWIKTIVKKEEVENDVEVHLYPITYEFGYDAATKEHKVICVWRIHRMNLPECRLISIVTICEVLTVGHNLWRRIDEVPLYDLKGASVCANGTIYWRKLRHFEGDEEPEVIEAFDVGSEKFRVIPVPNFILDQPRNKFFGRSVDLLEVDGCVALLHRMSGYTIKLWIFDDDKEQSATTGSTSNNWIEETILLPFCWEGHLCFKAVAGTDQIIVVCYRVIKIYKVKFVSLYSYNRINKTFRKVEIRGFSSSIRSLLSTNCLITTFVESLLPVEQQQQQQHHHI